jgi:MoxR-like ATPase
MSVELPPFDVYGGDGLDHSSLATQLPLISTFAKEHGRYLAEPALAESVNVALAVGQPLLVTGEPGCGKTRLAESIASELGLGDVLSFFTRSTSRARDVLYTFDSVLRFNDIQASHSRAADASNYVAYGPLGRAIIEGRRRVVLIDEIDKAPRDFPNDLLNELDRMTFSVPELPEGQQLKSSTVRPIVVITSNSERQLPLPFLRRCVFHHITFPKPEKLAQIVTERLGTLDLDAKLVAAAVDQFYRVRRVKGLVKEPSTGELLAWIVALRTKGISATELQQATLGTLPLSQGLVKDRDDAGRLKESSQGR